MAAATPKTPRRPSDAQPTSENITYEATLNAAASASRFPAGAFLDYAGLKKILEALAEMYATGDRPTEGLAYASLATTAAAPRGPTSFQVSSHEAFLEKLDGELAKCDDFAHREVVKVKRELAELESGGSRPRSGSLDGDPEEVEGWRVDAVGQHFLEVEKYVNVNVTAVRKMLRKHDAVLPQRPIAAFYTARMHDMRWVQTDYSSVRGRHGGRALAGLGCRPRPLGGLHRDQRIRALQLQVAPRPHPVAGARRMG